MCMREIRLLFFSRHELLLPQTLDTAVAPVTQNLPSFAPTSETLRHQHENETLLQMHSDYYI